MIILSNKIGNLRNGFSIMEMLVAMGVFTILMLATFGIFSASLKGQQNTLAQTRIEREAQLIMETIAKKIRSSIVDYSGYGGTITNPETKLILIDQADSQVVFQYDDINQDINLQIDGDAFYAISSNLINITSLEFFIEPTANPFPGGVRPATQPRVTAVMTLESKVAGELAAFTIQQTVPQRGGGF